MIIWQHFDEILSYCSAVNVMNSSVFHLNRSCHLTLSVLSSLCVRFYQFSYLKCNAECGLPLFPVPSKTQNKWDFRWVGMKYRMARTRVAVRIPKSAALCDWPKSPVAEGGSLASPFPLHLPCVGLRMLCSSPQISSRELLSKVFPKANEKKKNVWLARYHLNFDLK